jgi:hypothetical protein
LPRSGYFSSPAGQLSHLCAEHVRQLGVKVPYQPDGGEG